jgi:hypothetical protein
VACAGTQASVGGARATRGPYTDSGGGEPPAQGTGDGHTTHCRWSSRDSPPAVVYADGSTLLFFAAERAGGQAEAAGGTVATHGGGGQACAATGRRVASTGRHQRGETLRRGAAEPHARRAGEHSCLTLSACPPKESGCVTRAALLGVPRHDPAVCCGTPPTASLSLRLANKRERCRAERGVRCEGAGANVDSPAGR